MNYKKEYFNLLKSYYFYRVFLLIYLAIVLTYQTKEYFFSFGVIILVYFFTRSIWDLVRGISELRKIKKEIKND